MFSKKSKDWQLKSKDQLLTLDQNQLNDYVRSFVKKDEPLSDASSNDSREANARKYI